jgi:hypothetical protein
MTLMKLILLGSIICSGLGCVSTVVVDDEVAKVLKNQPTVTCKSCGICKVNPVTSKCDGKCDVVK